MTGHDIIVIGASAGGVETLITLVKGLPAGLPASILVACHFPPTRRSVLPEILSRAGPLLATHAVDGAPLYPGHIYVAPPDYHLLLQPGILEVSQGPREDHHRPAIDPLFRSAARAYGPRVIGLVLSGTLSDGVAGLMAVRAAGGIGVVQDPADAAVATLPLNATRIAGADFIVSTNNLASVLVELVHRPVVASPAPAPFDSDQLDKESIKQTFDEQIRGERTSRLTTLTCPDCGGSLWQFDNGSMQHFRCHTGHTFHSEALLNGQSQVLESALWSAVRTFKEKMILARQLARQEFQRGNFEGSQRFEDDAKLCEERSAVIQNTLLRSLEGPNRPGAIRPEPGITRRKDVDPALSNNLTPREERKEV